MKLAFKEAQSDTSLAKELVAIASEFRHEENPYSAIKYCNLAIVLAGKYNKKLMLASTYTDRGRIYSERGNFSASIKDFQFALAIYKIQRDKKNEANLYNLIANTANLQGDFPNALKNQYSA